MVKTLNLPDSVQQKLLNLLSGVLKNKSGQKGHNIKLLSKHNPIYSKILQTLSKLRLDLNLIRETILVKFKLLR